MKSSKILFPIFIIVLIIGLFPISVNAQSYYNWIESPSFSAYANYIEDGSFESGDYNTTSTYGYWNTELEEGVYTSSPYIGSAYSGVYAYGISGGNSLRVWYNLTDVLLGAEVTELSCYVVGSQSASDFYIYIYYSDDTSDSFSDLTLDYTSDWGKYDATESIDDAKYIVAFQFRIYYSSSIQGCIDNAVCYVNDGGGQSELAYLTSSPFYLMQTDYNIITISDSVGRTDLKSCRFQLTSSYANHKIGQSINYLKGSWVQYVDVYAYTALNSSEFLNFGVVCSVLYSDSTSDSKTVYLETGDSTWENLNFGSLWIDDNKFIVEIRFGIDLNDLSGYGSTIYLDDFGLWSESGYDTSRIDFIISPNPIEESSYYADLYSNVVYSINFYVYNETDGNLNENGTYLITTNLESFSGNVTNGEFDITLSLRTYTVSPYTVENVGVIIIIDDGDVLSFDLNLYWYPSGGGSSGSGNVTVDGDSLTDWFIFAVFLVVIPLGITVYVGGALENNSPMLLLITFMSSETLMSAISLSIGLINIWFILIVIIMDILIILGLLKSGR